MRAILLPAMALLLLGMTGCSADGSFDQVASAVEHRYSLHAENVPMMGFAGFMARIGTQNGVRGLHIAQFQGAQGLDISGVEALMESQLGSGWEPMVKSRNKSGFSLVFVRPQGQSMEMLVADCEHDELDLVGMELNGDALAKWLQNPEMNPAPLHNRDSHPASAN